MALSKLEQETIICFNEAERSVTISTYNSAMKAKLDALSAAHPSDCCLAKDMGYGCMRYIIPKKWLRIKAPMILSTEEKTRRAAFLTSCRPEITGAE